MTAPSSFDVRSQAEPGRSVLVSNELRLEVQRRPVERGVDRIDAQPACRGPRDHGHLAQSHAEDVERIDLDADLALERPELIDRRQVRDRPRDSPGPRPPRDPGVRLDLLGQDRADRLPVETERSLEVEVGPWSGRGPRRLPRPAGKGPSVPSRSVRADRTAARNLPSRPEPHFPRVRLASPGRRSGRVVKLEPNPEVPEVPSGRARTRVSS